MFSTHAIHPKTGLGRLSALLPLLVVCSACSTEQTSTPIGFGSQTSAGASATAAAGATGAAGYTGGTFSSAGTFTSAGTFATGGTFGSGGTADLGTAGSTNGGGAVSEGGAAGVGGTTSTGGEMAGSESGGAGGTAIVGCGKATGVDSMIDDFEDTDTSLKTVDGRNGPWENFDDGSVGAVYGGKTPMAGTGRGGSTGFCTSISGYKAWGANVVASMNSPKCGYDASYYEGVCFWAKGTVTAGGPLVFAVGTSDTVPDTSGGTCTGTGRCNAHYEARPALEDAAYKRYCYKWSELSPPNIATPPAFNPAAIVQIEWKFPANDAKSTDGNVCIDDIAFCKGETCQAD